MLSRFQNGQAMPAKPADEVKVSLLSDEESVSL